MGKYSKQQVIRNSKVCSCGQHHGKGDASPQEMAQMYNWFRQRDHNDWQRNDNGMRDYLQSYEAMHGKLGEDEFLFNSGRFA